jgi:hypothetical protein
MKPEDDARFVKAMSVMGEVFQKTPSDGLVDVYWKSLQDLDIEVFEKACSQVINARTITGTFPLVGEIREAAGGGKQALELRIIQAWDKLMYAVQRHGYYDSVIFDDPIIPQIIKSWGGWMEWSGGGKNEEFKWVRKDFERMYAAFATRVWPEQTEPCIGSIEHKNTLTGYSEHIPPPYLIKTHKGKLVSLPMPNQGRIGQETPMEALEHEIGKLPTSGRGGK